MYYILLVDWMTRVTFPKVVMYLFVTTRTTQLPIYYAFGLL